MIKTTAAGYPALETALVELHPYEVPEVIALQVAAGSAGYLEWVGDWCDEGRRAPSAGEAAGGTDVPVQPGDGEARARPRGAGCCLHVHALDVVGKGASSAISLMKSSTSSASPMTSSLDGAVGKVADGADHLEAVGEVLAGVAEADSLDPAVENHASCDHGRKDAGSRRVRRGTSARRPGRAPAAGAVRGAARGWYGRSQRCRRGRRPKRRGWRGPAGSFGGEVEELRTGPLRAGGRGGGDLRAR